MKKYLIFAHRCVVVDSGLKIERTLLPPLRVLDPPKVLNPILLQASHLPVMEPFIILLNENAQSKMSL